MRLNCSGQRLQLVAGLDIDAARQIAPADARRALLQAADRARQTAHVAPGERHEQQQASPPIAMPAMTGRS